MNDDSSPPFCDDQIGKSSTYDCPATDAGYFGYKVNAERVIQRGNFYIDVVSKSLNQNVYHSSFKLQVESLLRLSDAYIVNGSSYIQLNNHFSTSEINNPN